jgi:hypothetical protein
MGNGQWAMGKWAVGNGQWAVGKWASGQWNSNKFVAYYSLFAMPYSLFRPMPYSLFRPMPYSLFPIPHAPINLSDSLVSSLPNPV